MAKRKPSPIKDLPSIPWHRKTLLYRYGPESLEKHFDVALEIFESSSPTQRFEKLLASDGYDSIIEVGKRLEWLQSPDSAQDFEPFRLTILLGYQSFFLARGRVPSQSELLTLECQINILKGKPKTKPSLFFHPSSELYESASEIEIGDRRNSDDRKAQVKGMGLKFLNGKKLPGYLKAYRAIQSKMGSPEFSAFLREIGEPKCPNLSEASICELFEFLGAPISLDPYAIWKSNLITTKDFVSSLGTELPRLSKEEATQARCLYDLLMILGVYYQHLTDGFNLRELSDLSPSKTKMLRALAKELEVDLSPCAPDFLAGSDFDFYDAVSEPFSSFSKEKGELPSYFEFWFLNPAIRTVVIQTERIPENYIKSFQEFSDACNNSNVAPESPIKVLIGHSPVFRAVISALNPWWRNHEAAVYFDAISMSEPR